MKSPTELMPFGKYEGQPIEVLRSNPGYCQWLTAQAWFREKHAPIYQLIINNFVEPNETPEHNRLQTRFLDKEFCLHLLRALGWMPIADKDGLIRSTQQKLEEARSQLAKCSTSYDDYGRKKTLEGNIGEYESFLTHYPEIDSSNIKISNEFEYAGWDVKIKASLPFAEAMWRYKGLSDRIYKTTCSVEIKSEISDDYPAILRQMKANEQTYKADYRVLVFDNFSAAGATLEQVKQIFSSSGFYVLCFSDLNGVA